MLQDKLKEWASLAAAALFAVATVVLAVALTNARVDVAKAKLAAATVRDELGKERLDRKDDARQHELQARQQTERYRALERDMNQLLQEAERAAQPKRAAAADRARGDAVVLGGLRVDLDAFAAGGGPTSGDSLAACRSRAADLGSAVEEGMRLQAEMAGDFAALAVDYGVLHRGWPGSGAEPGAVVPSDQ